MSNYLENPYGEVYGYIRVSTEHQSLARQLDAMLEYGVREGAIFQEAQSGKNFNRTEYKRLMRVVRKGDIIVIKSIDRLGRNYDDILAQWRMLTQDIGCGIHVIDMPILNTSGNPGDLISKFTTDMMLQVLSFVAQNERETTIKRQQEGIKAARKRQVTRIGRPKIKIPYDFWEMFIIWKTGQLSPKECLDYSAKEWGISRRTFYRRIHELDQRFGDMDPNRLRDLIVEDDFLEGIEMSMERCDKAIGYYSNIAGNTEQIRTGTIKRKHVCKTHAEQEADDKAEEAELRRIILEKRQADFREKFGIVTPKSLDIANTNSLRVARGKHAEITNVNGDGRGTNMTSKQREAIKMAKSVSNESIRTLIIN